MGRVELLFVFEETAAALGSNNLRPGGKGAHTSRLLRAHSTS